MYGGIGAVCSGPSLISGRGAPLHPNLSSCAIRRAPECFCFGCRAQRCRGHLTGGEEAGDRRQLGDASPPTSPTSDLQRGVWGNFPRYNPEISAARKSKEVAKPLPLLLPPASTPPVRRPRQRPLLNQRTRRTSATPISHPAPPAARPNVFVSAAERSAAASILQEMKSQETGGDPKTLRPRRRRYLTRE